MKTSHHSLARVPSGSRLLCRWVASLIAAVTLGAAAMLAQSPPAPWQSVEIGSTGATGTTNYNSGTGTFTIEGAGDDIWNASDQFRFVYQSVSGDFTIVAKVESVENTNQWAKAGVMIRESTNVDSKYAFCFMTPSATNGGKSEYRATTAGSSTTGTQFIPSSPALPHWVKVTRAGNTFTAYESANGTTWTQAGSTQTIAMQSSVKIGLAVCSSVTGTLCTATFSNVSVTNGLPSPWSTGDVGAAATGSASYSGGTFTVIGGGAEIYYAVDAFRYVYQTISGDATIIARIATEQNTNQWAKVGVMFRESDAPGSKYCFLALCPDQTAPATDRGFLFEYRTATDGAAGQDSSSQTGYIAPHWLKLVRSGDSFTAFRSTDGSTWNTIGTAHTVAMNSTVLAGLVVCSHADPTLNTSTFTNVSVIGDTVAPSVSVTAPAGGANVRGTSVTVSATASDNVGVVGVQFKLDGANLGAEDTVSPYAITWNTTTATNGSHTLTAVARDAATNSTTATNVSVIVDNAVPTVSVTAPTGGATVSGASVSLTASASDTGGSGLAGVQFILDGSSSIGAEDTVSPYGVSWNSTSVANGSHTITAIARDNAGNLTTSTGVSVTVSNSGSLPPGWSAADIGTFTPPGTASYASGTGVYTVQGAGSNVWGMADQFQFVSQSISGDYAVVARVNSVGNTNAWAKGGIMFRETSATNSKYVYLLMTPNNGLLFEQRATTGGSSTQPGAVGTIDPPQWLKLLRAGDSFYAFYSDNGRMWYRVPGSPVTVSMSAGVSAGLAVCSVSPGNLCQVEFDNVTFTSGASSGGGLKAVFPKLATHDIGDKGYYRQSYQELMANFDFALLGFYKGWHGGVGPMRTAVQQIKALNPNMLLGNYTIAESQYWDQSNPNNAAGAEIMTKLYGSTGPTAGGASWTPNDWWGRNTSGAMVITEDPSMATINLTNFVTPDANGDRWPQWFAKWNDAQFFSQIPEIDVWYSDNAFWKPRTDNDWNRDGTIDLQTNSAVQIYYREGMARYWAKINQLQPGMIVMGNVDGNSAITSGYLRESEYQGKLGGALYESALGKSYSEENWSGWHNMMSSYRSLMANTAVPHMVVFDVKATPNGKCYEPVANQGWYGGGATYAFLRYAFASCLMDDGYFAVKNGGYSEAAGVWFDEFDCAGTADTSWLGAAIDPPPTGAYQDGVYLRRFQNGLAIVNPRSNPGGATNNRPPVDVLIPTSMGLYKRIPGIQDPTTNNGQNLPLNGSGVPHISVAPGDGIILMKQ